MKLEAKYRLLGAKLPKWASQKVPASIWQAVQAGKLEGRNNVSLTNDKDGTWHVDPYGAIQVCVPAHYFAACKAKNAGWALLHLVQHELLEAKTAIKLARAQYPQLNPYIAAETKAHLGGEAHVIVCKELDGLTESEYGRQLRLEDQFLGAK